MRRRGLGGSAPQPLRKGARLDLIQARFDPRPLCPHPRADASAPTRPVAWPPARVCERQDHDLVRLDLIRERKGEAIERSHPAVGPISPLRRRAGKPKDRFEDSIDFVFQLDAEPSAARLVVVDLVIDLGDRESMDAKPQRFARAARRRRTCARYRSSDIVSAASASTSAPRRSISASHACAESASDPPSRLRINSSAKRARSCAGRPRMSARMSVAPMHAFYLIERGFRRRGRARIDQFEPGPHSLR